MTAVGDKNVRGLNVAMHDSLGVRSIQRVRNFDPQRQHLVLRERLAGSGFLQGPPVEKFHGDKFAAVLLADIVNRANVRMIQRRRCLRFAPKTFQRNRIVRHFNRKEFQGDGAMQPGVFRLVNDAHPTAAKLAEDAVVRERLADLRRRIRHSAHILGWGSRQVNEQGLPEG